MELLQPPDNAHEQYSRCKRIQAVAKGWQESQKRSKGILHPRSNQKKVPVKVRKEKESVNENGETEIVEIEEIILVEKVVSFKPLPVFRYEDTEGEPLPEDNFSIEIPYEFNSKALFTPSGSGIL